MRLESRVRSDLGRLVSAVAPVDGVIGIILFGSYARGEYDEVSDYDVLVVFRDDESMWRHRRELYQRTGKLKLFLQLLTRSLKELTTQTEPLFLENILKDGQVLYSRFPFTFKAEEALSRPMRIFSYSLSQLTHQTKLRLEYRLYGKRVKDKSVGGALARAGGTRLGRGCILVPEEKASEVLQLFTDFEVKPKALPILIQQQKILHRPQIQRYLTASQKPAGYA